MQFSEKNEQRKDWTLTFNNEGDYKKFREMADKNDVFKLEKEKLLKKDDSVIWKIVLD